MRSCLTFSRNTKQLTLNKWTQGTFCENIFACKRHHCDLSPSPPYGTTLSHQQASSLQAFFYLEDGGRNFAWNVGNLRGATSQMIQPQKPLTSLARLVLDTPKFGRSLLKHSGFCIDCLC
jgi:hypothetical protein